MPALALSATALASCDRPKPTVDGSWTTSAPTQVCVDAEDRRVADENCPSPNGSHPVFVRYLPSGGTVPEIGGEVRGADTERVPGETYESPSAAFSRPGATERGGFGETAEAHGAFGEGGDE